MTPEQWQRINELFFEALEVDPDERTTFLDRRCVGEDSLRTEVERLLVNDATTAKDQLLDAGVELDTPFVDGWIGKELGPFRIERQIGQGGMGTVYQASRINDFNQQVAIKVLSHKTTNPELHRRFQHEIRFVASLSQHPNIARLLDAGKTAEDQPFFVMEYVDGERMDEFCNRTRKSVRERIQLFAQVCDAIVHAHQRGVIHRDLKPTNVLITKDGNAKLIDFGIAKLIDPELDSPATATQTANRFLTPEYASPEQILGETLTTASDVYSLGVMLYELLTGRRPYQVVSGSARELERIIREDGPPRPSSIATQTEPANGPQSDRRKRAEDRSTRPERLRKALAGDLDQIILKALQGNPTRRYHSVAELSADLDRYLSGKPVLARGDSVGYRLRRYVQRHKIATVLACLLVVALAVGAGGLTLGYLEAKRQRVRADQRLELAMESVDRMLTRVGNERLDDIPHMAVVRRELLEDALEMCERIVADLPASEANLLVGDSHYRLGMIQRRVGQVDAARGSLEKAMEAYRDLPQETMRAAQWQRAAEIRNELGRLEADAANFDQSRRHYSRALRILRGLWRRKGIPKNYHRITFAMAQTLNNLASVLAETEPPDKVEPYYSEAIPHYNYLLRARPNSIKYQDGIATTLNNLGWIRRKRGRHEAAERTLRIALRYRRRLADSHPTEVSFRASLATAYDNLAHIQTERKRYAGAENNYRESIRILEMLARDFPGFPRHQDALARLHNKLAVLHCAQENFTAAEPLFQKSIGLHRDLVKRFKDTPGFLNELAHALRSYGALLSDTGRKEQANQFYDEAHQAQEELVERNPNVPEFLRDLATSFRRQARRFDRAGDHQRAESAYQRCFETAARFPGGLAEQADLLEQRGQKDLAIRALSEAIARNPTSVDLLDKRASLYRKAAAAEKAIADYTTILNHHAQDHSYWRRRGSVFRDLGEFDKALADYEQALKLNPTYASAWNSRGLTKELMGNWTDAAADYRQAGRLAPDDPVSWVNLSRVLMYVQDWDSAAIALEEAFELTRKMNYLLQRAWIQAFQQRPKLALNLLPDNSRADARILEIRAVASLLAGDKASYAYSVRLITGLATDEAGKVGWVCFLEPAVEFSAREKPQWVKGESGRLAWLVRSNQFEAAVEFFRSIKTPDAIDACYAALAQQALGREFTESVEVAERRPDGVEPLDHIKLQLATRLLSQQLKQKD